MLNIGVLGCGNISNHYFRGPKNVFFNRLSLVSCSDIILERAQNSAKTYNIPKAYQREMALKSELQNPLIYRESEIKIQPRCRNCRRRNSCNGCKWCGKCSKGTRL